MISVLFKKHFYMNITAILISSLTKYKISSINPANSLTNPMYQISLANTLFCKQLNEKFQQNCNNFNTTSTHTKPHKISAPSIFNRLKMKSIKKVFNLRHCFCNPRSETVFICLRLSWVGGLLDIVQIYATNGV